MKTHTNSENRIPLFSTLLIGVLFQCSQGSALAQVEKKDSHQIDTKLNECLQDTSNYNTFGMVQCLVLAVDEWDKEMNKNYQRLLNELTAEQQEKLRISQRQWVAFRDKEMDFAIKLHNDLGGTIRPIYISEIRKDLIKQRALELRSYSLQLKGRNE